MTQNPKGSLKASRLSKDRNGQGQFFFESGGPWECVFLLNLQCVVGANSSYKSSCLMSLPRWSSKWRCHHIKKEKNSSRNQIVGGGKTVLREYYTLISLISQTIFNQLQMQPFKHPCILWGIHLPDIVLPWQKSSCQNIPFIHKLQFSFEERHYFFQERVSLQNIKQSSEHAAFLS